MLLLYTVAYAGGERGNPLPKWEIKERKNGEKEGKREKESKRKKREKEKRKKRRKKEEKNRIK